MSRGRGLGAGRLWKRDRAWVLDYADARGQRRREVLGTSRRDAEELRVEIIAKRNRVVRGLDVERDDIQLDRLKVAYLADLKARASAAHVRNVEGQLKRILAALDADTVSDVKPLDVVDYRARLVEQGKSTRWANINIQSLRGMLNWAVKMGLVSESPLARIDKLPDGPRNQKCKRRALDDAEIEAFLEAAEQEDADVGEKRVRIPQAAFWRFLLESGCRYGEARTLTWSDIDETNAVVTLRAESTKAGRERLIPLRRELLVQLQELRAHHWRVTERRPLQGDAVFLTSREGRALQPPTNNANRSLRRLLRKAGIPRVDEHGRKIDLHALRHSCGSRLARNGVELATTQRLLGHSSPVLTSKHYLHLGVEDLRKAVESVAASPAEPTPEHREVRQKRLADARE